MRFLHMSILLADWSCTSADRRGKTQLDGSRPSGQGFSIYVATVGPTLYRSVELILRGGQCHHQSRRVHRCRLFDLEFLLGCSSVTQTHDCKILIVAPTEYRNPSSLIGPPVL